MSCGPLHGVKVIEVAHMLSTPLCTQLLGDLGADVVKVEAIGKGDRSREGAPIFQGGERVVHLPLQKPEQAEHVP